MLSESSIYTHCQIMFGVCMHATLASVISNFVAKGTSVIYRYLLRPECLCHLKCKQLASWDFRVKMPATELTNCN